MLAYADDITLLCPSVRGMQKLLDICEKYAKEYDVTFNAEKTECICFQPKGCQPIEPPPCLTFFGERLTKWMTKITHLGHVINYDLSDSVDIKMRSAALESKANELCINYHFVEESVIIRLFKQLCCCFFGAVTYDFINSDIFKLNNAVKKSLRKLLNLPRDAKSYYVLKLANIDPVQYTILSRLKKFNEGCQNVDNDLVNYFQHIAKSFPRTISGRNVFCVNHFLINPPSYEFLSINNESDDYIVNTLRELIIMRFNRQTFTYYEIQELIELFSKS